MKKFILTLIICVMSFGFSSCVSSQTTYADYQKVYFDRVINGHIIADDYVWDGTYSYHILGLVPKNIYWELYPTGWDVYLYNTNMVRLRLFDYNRRYIFYNRGFHNYYRFDNRHRPPFNPNRGYNRPIYRNNGGKPNVMPRKDTPNNKPNGGIFNKPNTNKGGFNQSTQPSGRFGGNHTMKGSSRNGSFGGGASRGGHFGGRR